MNNEERVVVGLYRSLERLSLAIEACGHIGFSESTPTTNETHASIWQDLNEAQKDAKLKLKHYRGESRAEPQEPTSAGELTANEFHKRWDSSQINAPSKYYWYNFAEAYHAAASAGTLAEHARKVDEKWEHACVTEIASVNQSVSDYVEHWEGRAEAAESEVRELRVALTRYGQHEMLCQLRVHPEAKCSCGFESVLGKEISPQS